jgi:hypothetical protein
MGANGRLVQLTLRGPSLSKEKVFSEPLMKRSNKLEYLSLVSLFNLGHIFASKARISILEGEQKTNNSELC